MTFEQHYRDHAGKVSHKWSSYLRVYEAALAPYREASLRLLEIGVQNGGSREIWAKMFPNAEMIVGCDVDPRCAELHFDDSRIHVVVADANSQDGFTAIKLLSQTFDIVIDDGSHRSSDILASFAKYFPLLSDGGLYIAEDLHCSYWPEYEGGLQQGPTAIEFFKGIVDILNEDHWREHVAPTTIVQPFLGVGPYAADLSDRQLRAISSVSFFDSLCLIQKATSERGLGRPVVSGQDALVNDEVLRFRDLRIAQEPPKMKDFSRQLSSNDNALEPLELEALFFRPSRLGVHSAWWGHVPFAHWIVSVTRPATIVELGVHNGVSFSAFCEAVLRTGYSARCFGIDTWEGDEHAGFYGDEVYSEFRSFHDVRYGAFSELIRATFEDSLDRFPDGSIDLLHIDGLHTYDAVRLDYANWLTKLSDRGIILFHDTQVRERNFGVWKLWEELSDQFPSFEFRHAHGLGVLGVGKNLPEPINRLCTLSGESAEEIKIGVALVGERLTGNSTMTLSTTVEQNFVAEKLRKKNSDLERELGYRLSEIKELRESTSWRITSPLRYVRSRINRKNADKNVP